MSRKTLILKTLILSLLLLNIGAGMNLLNIQLVKAAVPAARIDSYYPNDSNNPARVAVGSSVSIGVTFTNTGTISWMFIAGATIWDSTGSQVANYEKTLVSYLSPGQQTTVSWSHTVSNVGDYWLQFGVWKAKPYIADNLLDKKPSPSQRLIVGYTAVTLSVYSTHDSPNPSVGGHPYGAGSSVTCSVTSPADQSGGIRYRCTGYTGTGSCPSSSGTSVTFTITQSSTITWNWVAQYSLTVASAHDSPSPSIGTWWYDSGAPVTCSVTSPAEGYSCTGWTGTGSVPSVGYSTSTGSFSITQGSAITWSWIVTPPVPRTLTVSSAHDSPVPGTGPHTYNNGDSVTCSVTSPVTEGSTIWTCTGWTGTGSVPSVGYSSSTGYFNIYQDSSITWNWQSSSVQRTLTVSSAHDSPNPSNGAHSYTDGQSVTCSVSSPVTEGGTGWTCTGWSGTGSVPSSGSSTSTGSFIIYQDSSITWNWIVTPPAPDFSISASPFPSPLSIPAGGSGKWILTITSISGFSVPVQLDVSSLYGVQLTCPTEAQPPPDGSITVDLEASVYLWAPPGIYELAVTGTFGVLTRTLKILLRIELLPPPEISSWKVTNLYETSTWHEFLGQVGNLVGYTIDCDFDVFVTDYYRVQIIRVEMAGCTPFDLVDLGLGHFRANLGIYHRSMKNILLNSLLLANDLTTKETGPPLPEWYEEPTIPYCAVTEITIMDTNNNVYHLTQSKIGQVLPERLPNFQDTVNAKASSWRIQGGTLFRGDCAVDFLATDALGRRVGALYQNGQFVGAINEIPNAFYSGQDPDLQVIFIPASFENCTIQTTGRNSGTYALGVLTFTEQASERFVAINIPSLTSATQEYDVDWNTLDQGGQGVVVDVDIDGNGIAEYNFTSDSELSRIEYVAATTQHDLGITGITALKSVTGEGYTLPINMTTINYGVYTETFNVTFYVNTTLVESRTVALASGSSTTMTFPWDTTGLAYGNYILGAYAEPVLNETYVADNNVTWTVHVGVPGDVSGPTQGVYDGTTNMRDVQYLILRFNTNPSSSNWNPNADINDDGTVNMRDIQIAILNFNQHE